MQKLRLFQMGVSYGQSLLAYYADKSPRPFSAAFAITNKCNLRCSYCSCPYLNTKELDLKEIEILFRQLKKVGVLRLGIFGGEPLVRKDIGEVLALAKSFGFFISLNTNLNLYHRYKAQLDCVDYFFTSLDGLPEKHIRNRGKNSLNGVHEAIQDIVDKGKKLTAICVVTEPDYESVEYLLDYAERTQIDIHFQAECFDAEKAGRDSSVMVFQDEMKEFWKHILLLKKNGKPITTSRASLDYIINWENYQKTSLYDPNVKCAAGRGFLFVESDGKGYACTYIKGQEKIEGIDLLKENWNEKFNGETPCSKCIVGSHLEFNLLYQKPFSAVRDALEKIKM